MKKKTVQTLLCTIIFCLISSIGYAQDISFNFGGTSQTGYFTEIKYENIGDKVVIKVILGVTEHRFLLDTGGPNVISRKLFDSLRSSTLDSVDNRKTAVWDAGGRVDSLIVVNLNGIKLGNVSFNDVPTLVTNDQFIFDCLQVDGSIGSNMLRNSILQFSSKEHTITLTDLPEKVNLNNKVFSNLYLNQVQSAPFIDIKLGENGQGSIPMLFDTGDNGFVSLALSHYLLSEKYQIFNVLTKSKGYSALGAHGVEIDTVKYRLRATKMDINGAIFKNITLETTPNDNSSIGSDLLKYGIATLDYKNKKFYFEPYQTPVDVYTGSFPVSLTLNNNKATIGVVWDKKLAEQISIGDQLLSVDGKDYTQLSACDFALKAKAFEGKTKVTLKLKSKDGKIKEVTITRI